MKKLSLSTCLLAATFSLPMTVLAYSPSALAQDDFTFAEKLSDGQVAGFIDLASRVEVEAAQVGQRRTKNADVRTFADKTIAAQRDLASKFQGLLGKLGITPAASLDSVELQGIHLRNLALLEIASEQEFDKVFMQQQIDETKRVLEILDSRLLPALQSNELKQFLTEVRPTVAATLENAKALRSTLGN